MNKLNIEKLKELALAVQGWSNCDSAWLDNSEDVSVAVLGHIDESGETYPAATIDCDQYYAGADSLKLAQFYAAANPANILALIESHAELLAALKDLPWRIEDIADALQSRGVGDQRIYGCDEWSTPVVNLNTMLRAVGSSVTKAEALL